MFGQLFAVSMVAALVTVAAGDGSEPDVASTSTTGPNPTVSPPTRSPTVEENISGAITELLETDAVLRVVDEDGGRDPETDSFREIVVATVRPRPPAGNCLRTPDPGADVSRGKRCLTRH